MNRKKKKINATVGYTLKLAHSQPQTHIIYIHTYILPWHAPSRVSLESIHRSLANAQQQHQLISLGGGAYGIYGGVHTHE